MELSNYQAFMECMRKQVGKDWLQHPLRSCPLGADAGL